MVTVAEVAAWMYAEFARAGELRQADAVAGIRARFGEAFVPGGQVRRDVRAAFRQLAPEGLVFVGSRKAWRRRNAFDPPERGRGRGP